MSAANFGPRLRTLRKARGLDQKTLANCGGIHHTYLSKVENGRATPPKEATIRRLADALSYNPERLTLEAGRIPAHLRERVAAALLDGWRP